MCGFAERKKPALVVSILSIIVLLSGLILLIESSYYLTNGDIFQADFGTLSKQINKFRRSSGTIYIALACSALIIGGLGATCGCKRCQDNRCYSVWYGLILLVIWVLFLLIGIGLMMISSVSTKTLT